MPVFITQGRYTQSAIQGLVDSPEDRRQAVAALAEASGGRLVDLYITFGENDFLVIIEAPSINSVLSALFAVAATGTVTDLKTVPAVSTAEAKDAMEAAQAIRAGFKPAGSG